MTQDADPKDRPPERRKPHKANRKTINIQFARSLSPEEMNVILQLELTRARTKEEADQVKVTPEVTLPSELVHEIKFRLTYYSRTFGDISDEKREDFIALERTR